MGESACRLPCPLLPVPGVQPGSVIWGEGGEDMLTAKGHGKSSEMVTISIIHNRYYFVLLSLSSEDSEPASGDSKRPGSSLGPSPVQVVIRPIYTFLITVRDRELTT